MSGAIRDNYITVYKMTDEFYIIFTVTFMGRKSEEHKSKEFVNDHTYNRFRLIISSIYTHVHLGALQCHVLSELEVKPSQNVSDR